MPSVKKKNLVRKDAFSCYDGCRVVTPNGHPFFGSMLIFNGCRVVMPNGHPFFGSMLIFNGCRVVMPNDHFSFFCVFSVDVQWVSGSHKREA